MELETNQMQDLIGRTLGHYRIVEKIGAGGMGEIYRARDERLDRDVAIKVLPDEVARDPGRLARFEREAKAVAALSHPNILEIFDFDTEGDLTFSVTELLDGTDLQTYLQRSGGPLPWRTAQEIVTSVARGLEAAHGNGVIHRDIKPSNIFMCAEGRVKILDFGLAATFEVADCNADTRSFQEPLTRQGSVIGTVGYMSPEQVRGESTDFRTDIFALGCILYEMLTGRRAFFRDTAAESMTAVLREEPASFVDSAVEVPEYLETAVWRCLEKDPDLRYQSASDFLHAIKHPDLSSTPSSGANPPSSTHRRWMLMGIAIVVVVAVAVGFWMVRNRTTIEGGDLDPKKAVIAVFENRTGDPSLDLLGTLVSEALAEDASGIGGFSIIPSPASFGQRIVGGESGSGSRAFQSLAEETGAGVVVSGSYYLLGNDLRFQSQLTNAITGEILYSLPAVTGPRDSPGNVIEQVRQRVLGAAAWHFEGQRTDLLTPPLLAAFREYRRGRDFFMMDLEKEVLYFRRAVELDPDFFQAWSQLYVVYANRDLCDQAALMLVEVEPRLTHFTQFERLIVDANRAFLAGKNMDVLRAHQEMDAILGQQRSYMVGLMNLKVNRPREAAEIFGTTQYPTDASPPYSAVWPFWWLSRAHHVLENYEEELRVVEESLHHFPSDILLHGRKTAALAAMGRLDDIDGVINDAELVQSENTLMIVMLDAAGELRAHGHPEAAVRVAIRGVDWVYSQPPEKQDALRPELADALALAERWQEAKDVADAFLVDYFGEGLLVPSGEGTELVSEEGGRSRGGPWWGDWGMVVALGRVGTLAARLGDREEALLMADRLRDFDSRCPAGNRTYQRACIACQLGDLAGAIRLLKQAISEGFSNYWGVHADFNLEPLWDDPEFLELMRPKG